MDRIRHAVPAALGIVLVALGPGCGSDAVGLFVTGSSTVEPISVRTAELFDDVSSDVFVSVEGPGTGDGFKKFCAGEADLVDASRPIKEAEAADCAAAGIDHVELPVAYDGLAVVVHPDNPVECLSFADLYALLGPEARSVTRWDGAEPIARALGSSTDLPSLPLVVSAPGTESGTYDSFVELVIADTGEARAEEGFVPERDAASLRPDYPSAADDNMILSSVGGQTGGLGFIGYAYAAASDEVRLVPVDGGEGCVAPDAQTIADGTYPIARTLYVYVSLAALEARPQLADFVDFYVEVGLVEAVPSAGYVPLPDAGRADTRDRWLDAR